MKRRKILFVTAGAALLVAALVACWNVWLSPTRVAFVNYQTITLGQIAKANNNSFVKIRELAEEELAEAGDYDMVFVNGMGLRLTEQQRALLTDAADNGTPVLTTAATNPNNLVVSVDSVDREFLQQYLAGGGCANYRNMLGYVRRFIDGKKFKADLPGDPVAAGSSLLYHPDFSGDDKEMLGFASVAEYEKYLAANGMGGEQSPRIILTGQMGVPDSLIAALERAGITVYPVTTIQQFIKNGHADSVAPSAMINMAHGRMGDAVVDYLTRNNVPLFSPLNVNCDYDKWMDDKMGMNGGFLSQSVVTPEIDGAVRPFALFAHYKGDDGLPYVAAIPDRLDEFVATVGNYLSLRLKSNGEKRVAIFYFKGPGQNALVAEGMEVAPSLYNMLCRLRAEGYNVAGLPGSVAEFERQLNERGRVFGHYAEGAMADFIKDCSPQLVGREDYEQWLRSSMDESMLSAINAVDGEFPGHGLSTPDGKVALARLQYGNVVLIPQTAAGIGDDDFKMVHGTESAPPHAYVAAYLWARCGFGADALIHFGAHGSLEFTPRKQAALCSNDWPDRLVGTMPHFYIYSTSNVGEAMMAKRRSYATIINYLTPPFMESGVRGIYRKLSDAVAAYNREAFGDNPDDDAVKRASLAVKRHAVELGIHRELRLDSVLSEPYSEDEVARIETFAEELANEKITGALYRMGVPYDSDHLESTVLAMTVDPVAYSLYSLDRACGRAGAEIEKHKGLFAQRYSSPARALVKKWLKSGAEVSDDEICRIAGIDKGQLAKAREIDASLTGAKDLFSKMLVMGSMMQPKQPTAKVAERLETHSRGKMMSMPGMSPEKALAMARKMGADEEALKKMEASMKKGDNMRKPGGHPHGAMMPGMGGTAYTQAERDEANAIMEVERAIRNVGYYREALLNSPEAELASVVNALAGGYVAPTSGGDPVLNPRVLPTGRNMFAINAEETPTVAAWEKGKSLVDNTIKMYRQTHNDSLPRKVSYTLWSSEFIETEGVTIAQVLYMLGVEPVRDPFGRVTDLRLIPSAELGRPRIDVVVQTSGQLRDLAASRLFLIDRAVKMAAAATADEHPNYVAEGAVASERHLVDRGVSPKEAREISTARVFGGVDGNYGSGIQQMVEAGDRWDDESQIAETYINNMGAYYGSEQDWERMREFAFEAALTNTDAVVQPRQSNTWGALSLDHVYEFMGGMNLAVRTVTGKDPEAYLSDYRNRNNVKMQEIKEAVGVESRTTILNPTYIKEKMKGGAGDAGALADVVRNTYGWNVMKPAAIDDELWDDIYETYVKDRNRLGTREFFTSTNPAALEEMTAVMMETARKGMWDATPEQLADIARLHTEIVNEYKPSCSGFVCDNAKLRDFIAANVSPAEAQRYNESISEIRAENASNGGDGKVMRKETLNEFERSTNSVNGVAIAALVVVALVAFYLIVKRKKVRSRNSD